MLDHHGFRDHLVSYVLGEWVELTEVVLNPPTPVPKAGHPTPITSYHKNMYILFSATLITYDSY